MLRPTHAMTERTLFQWLLWAFLALALLTLPALFFITAPYGRHGAGRGFGPKINATLAWVVMESPSAIAVFVCYLLGTRRGDPAAICFLLLWELHYVHRAFVFPFRRQGTAKLMRVEGQKADVEGVDQFLSRGDSSQ